MKFKKFYQKMNENTNKANFEKDLDKIKEKYEFTYNIMVLGKDMYAVIHPYYQVNRQLRIHFSKQGYKFGSSGKDFFQVYPKK